MQGIVERAYGRLFTYAKLMINPLKKTIIHTECQIHKMINVQALQILDPPAFTKSRSAVEGAVRGYKEINLRAMKIIKSGGFLVTCSCSHHVDADLFMDIVYSASIDARKKVRLLEYRSQSKDHPVLLASEETEYLKCAILQIV